MVDVFCQFCVFCDRERRQVWVCDVFCQKLSLFNNMLIDLDRRYLYGLIGKFTIFLFYFFVFYRFYFVCVFCLNTDKEKIWKEGFLKRVWYNR